MDVEKRASRALIRFWVVLGGLAASGALALQVTSRPPSPTYSRFEASVPPAEPTPAPRPTPVVENIPAQPRPEMRTAAVVPLPIPPRPPHPVTPPARRLAHAGPTRPSAPSSPPADLNAAPSPYPTPPWAGGWRAPTYPPPYPGPYGGSRAYSFYPAPYQPAY